MGAVHEYLPDLAEATNAVASDLPPHRVGQRNGPLPAGRLCQDRDRDRRFVGVGNDPSLMAERRQRPSLGCALDTRVREDFSETVSPCLLSQYMPHERALGGSGCVVLPDERKDIYEIGGRGTRYQQGVVFPGIGQKVGIQIIGVTANLGRVQIGCE